MQQIRVQRAGKMAQQLAVLATLSGSLHSIHNTDLVVYHIYNSSSKDLTPSSGLQVPGMHADKILTDTAFFKNKVHFKKKSYGVS